MATPGQWVQGARLRTLPNAVAPVLAGAGVAARLDRFSAGYAALALAVALSLVVGVNYANDYSDGVRGTDTERVGPTRLVGAGLAHPVAVRSAALSCFAIAAAAGLALVALSGSWWLLVLGAACIAGAWFYTGGRRPYGYAGIGEPAVFLFFGPVAVLGTQYVLAGRVSAAGVAAGIAVGALSAAVLVANNLRDIRTDGITGKHTLAVRLGGARTRRLYGGLVTVPFAVTLALIAETPAALAGLLALPLASTSVLRVLRGAGDRELIAVLRDTAIVMLIWAAVTGLTLALA